MPTESNVETLEARGAESTAITDGAEDISGGKRVSMQTPKGDAAAATLFLETNGAVDVTVEFSPDDGTSWYEPAAESPVAFDSAGQDIVFIEFGASHVRITGSNTTGVDADLRVRA